MSSGYSQGIRTNWKQFLLQVLTVFAVGLTMGSQRTVVPVMSEETFGVTSFLVIGSFVVSFGVVKAVLNLYSGKWADAHGRKPILILGWLSALPIPFILIFAPSWEWIVAGNLLLGINQGVAWSMSMISKIELAGPEERGLAAGIDEAFGYTGVAIGAWLTGVIAAQYSLRPEPFYFLLLVIIVAMLIAVFFIEETLPYAKAEAKAATPDDTAIIIATLAIGVGGFTIARRTMESVGGELSDIPLLAALFVMVTASTITTLLSWLGIPISLVMATVMTIVGIGWGRATRPVTIREAVTRDVEDKEITPGTITAEEMEGRSAAPIGQKEPEEVLEAGDLFNPRAIIKYISMWIIGPSISTILAYGFFLLLPGVA